MWKAVYANAEIPDEAAAELESTFEKARKSESVVNTLSDLYSEPSEVPADELIEKLQTEHDENATTFAELGIIDE